MAAKDAIPTLEKLLGRENVITGPEDLLCYSYDATPDMPAGRPLVVVTPSSTSHVQQVVRLAAHWGLPIYPRGSGTNLSGGAIPLENGIVLSTVKMNRILEVDADNLLAIAQPGVVINKLNQVVAPHGLIYPPDPATVATATLGGSVAECSGGLRGLKYGVTRNYIMGLEVVLADGQAARFGGRTLKNVTAYDMVRLFTGSEGTLGIITEITVRLIPAPEARQTMMASFQNLADAGNAVTAIVRSRVIPATLEIMDQVTIRTVEAYAKIGLPTDAAAILLVEVDGVPEAVVREAATVQRVIGEYRGTVRVAANNDERERLWAARRAALPALAQLRPTTVLEDATVPRNRITEMLTALHDIAAKYRLTIGSFGHAGDGNLHPTILTDVRDRDEMERVHQAVTDIFRVALSLGGTLTGEHGIGLAKKRFLPLELGTEGVSVIKAIKRALDPANILNPGKLVPEEGAKET